MRLGDLTAQQGREALAGGFVGRTGRGLLASTAMDV